MNKGAMYMLISSDNVDDYFKEDNIQNMVVPETIRSANSLKKHMPDIPIYIYTNVNENVFKNCAIDKVITIEKPKHRFWADKYKILKDSPFDKTLFLDGDTLFCNSVYEVFDTLDKYDIAAAMSVSWRTRRQKIPICFPELAGGVLFFGKNDRTTKLFQEIIDMLDVPRRRGGCDEPYLRFALYNNPEVRFYVLPFEYNCLYTHPGYLFDEVKILHGHSFDVEKDAEIINTKVYEDYPPFKRLHTGKRLLLYKKKKQKIMCIEKELEYGGIPWGEARA